MKMFISNTLITALSGVAVNLITNAQGLKDSHPYLKKQTEKDAERMMSYTDMTKEEALKKASTIELPTSLIGRLKNKVLKLGSLTKTDEGVEIEIKDDFILEGATLGVNLLIKMLKPTADLFSIIDDHEVHIKQFNERWDEEKVEVTSKAIDASEVPKSIHDPVVAASEWTVKEAKHAGKSTVLLDNAEDFITTADLECTNGNGRTLDVYTHTLAHIIGSKKSLDDTAKYVSVPASLVNVLRAHYNLPLLTNPVEEVKEAVVEAEPAVKDATTASAKANK